ncbi:hypothetical protein [Amycolatopsis sp. NPDC051102]|uniref:hypothetical protein n=1 Tax=Amycolatopsis sp. NPDC051102 TaxID=3155163 RepID=UPI00344647BA
MDDVVERVLRTPPADLRIDRVLVLDWYDGPIEGYLRLADPVSCWKYKVIAVRRPEDDVDDRLYALSAAPDDTFDRLGEDPEPDDGELDRLERTLPGPALIVRSTHLADVTAVWQVNDR